MLLLKEFVIKGTPSTVTAQQKGERVVHGKVFHYKKANVRLAEAELRDDLLEHVPEVPYQCAIYLRVMWLFDKKALAKKDSRTFKKERPDLDNLLKGTADVMTDMGFWGDDSQLVKVDLTKAWSKEYPGLFIQIFGLTSEEDYDELVENWRVVPYD